jgi:hypothetical protein
MATQVQYAGRPTPRTKKVYYKHYAGAGQLADGHVLDYDLAAPITPAAGTFKEQVLGVQVRRPVDTPSHRMFAGVVRSLEKYRKKSATDFSQPVEIWTPRTGEFLLVLTKANMTLGVTYLSSTDDEFHLIAQAHTGNQMQENTIAIAAETKDTSVTAALAWIMFVR